MSRLLIRCNNLNCLNYIFFEGKPKTYTSKRNNTHTLMLLYLDGVREMVGKEERKIEHNFRKALLLERGKKDRYLGRFKGLKHDFNISFRLRCSRCRSRPSYPCPRWPRPRWTGTRSTRRRARSPRSTWSRTALSSLTYCPRYLFTTNRSFL